MFTKSKKLGAALVAAPVTLLVATSARADVDYSQITSGIDFSSIATGVLAVAALLAGVYAAIRGARIVLSFLRS